MSKLKTIMMGALPILAAYVAIKMYERYEAKKAASVAPAQQEMA